MEKLNKDVLNYIVSVGELKGRDLVSFSSLNTYTKRIINFVPALRKEFEIYKLNRWNPRKLYIRMYLIKRNYMSLLDRMELLGGVDKNIHGEYGRIYTPTYLYDVLYAKYTYDKRSFLSSIFEETDEMILFYDHLNVLEHNRIRRLTEEEYMIEHGSEYDYNIYYNKKRMQYDNIDLKNIWFEYVRGEDRPLWEKGTRFQSAHINKDYIDSLWDDSVEIMSRNLMTTHKKEKTSHYSFLESHIQNNYAKFMNQLLLSNDFSNRLINNCKRFYFRHDIYKLSRREINMIISLHDLVMEGIISITMPISFLLEVDTKV